MTRRPHRRTRHAAATFPAAVLLAAGSAHAQTFTSVRSGAWTDPATWNAGGAVPGSNAIVRIAAPHTVWGVRIPGTTSFGVACDTLTVAGVLVARPGNIPGGLSVKVVANRLAVDGVILAEDSTSWFGGQVTISCPDVEVGPTGIIRAGNASTKAGGNVYVAPPFGVVPGVPHFEPGRFVNRGLLTAGDGVFGGSVLVTFTPPPPAPGSPPLLGLVENHGEMRGGTGSAGGGSVQVSARQAFNHGLARGGSSTSEGWAGGEAILIGGTFPPGGVSECSNFGGGTIRGGDGTLTLSLGGNASMHASGWLSTTTVAAGGVVIGGFGCPPGSAAVFGPRTVIEGWVRPGFSSCPPSRPTRVDPPDGVIAGDASITGHHVEISGQNITIESLNNPGAIDASGDVEFLIAPGGALDLTGLTPGTPWVRAGGTVRVAADTVLLPPGTGLHDFIGSLQPPLMEPARATSVIEFTPDTGLVGDPGQTVALDAWLLCTSNVAQHIELRVNDSRGWIVPRMEFRPLEGVDAMELRTDVQVPPHALPGEFTTIMVDAREVLTQRHFRTEYRVEVGGEALACPCACDFDTTSGPGVCDIFDFLAFQNQYSSGAPCACDCDTTSGPGVCDIFDFLCFQNAYSLGCP